MLKIIYKYRPFLFTLICVLLLSSYSYGSLEGFDFQRIFEEHSTVRLIIDAESGAIEYANNAAVRFYGYAHDELLQMKIQEINILSPEETEKERMAAANGERNDFKFTHRLANDEIRNVEVRSYPIEHNGKILLYSVINDITAEAELEKSLKQRNDFIYFILIFSLILQTCFIVLLINYIVKNKKMQTQIKDSEQDNKKKEKELRTLYSAIEQSTSVVIITDDEGNIEYVNKKFMETTGYEYAEIIGQNSIILKGGEEAIRTYRDILEQIASGKEWHGEYINKKKDNTTYWAWANIAPIIDDQGKISNIISVHLDISERKEMEKRLKETNDQLVETLDSLRLLQQQLVQQEKMAAIGQLAAGVAHEINNPLGYVMCNFEPLENYINVFTELLKLYHIELEENSIIGEQTIPDMINRIESYKTEKNVDFMLEDIEDLIFDCNTGLRKIQSIVQGLTSFSKGNEIDSFVSFDLNQGIHQALTMTKHEMKNALFVDLELTELPRIEASPHLMNKGLLNLLLNAIQAIQDNNVTGQLKITTLQQDSYAIMIIEDNGVGIPDENLNKIFNPFFTTKAIGKNTGLGLSITYDIIVNIHGGDIKVKSEINVGTKFTVKLPINQKKN